jgi:SAM-dependent methyltransferase
MPLMTQTIKPFNNKVFLETGCYEGCGIQTAIDAGYEKIISIDISEYYLELCREKFKNDKRVKLILGDSAEVLGDIIKSINEPIVFWLDGHYSGGDKPRGKYLSPLMQELDFISKHNIKTHTILIDDMWCWKEMNNEYHDDFDVNMIVNKIYDINPNYTIDFVDGACFKKDILLAHVKINTNILR